MSVNSCNKKFFSLEKQAGYVGVRVNGPLGPPLAGCGASCLAQLGCIPYTIDILDQCRRMR